MSLSPTGVLTVMVGALLRTQIAILDQVAGPIDADRRELVDRHAAAVARLVHAILARDREAALRAGLDPELRVIFAAAPTQS